MNMSDNVVNMDCGHCGSISFVHVIVNDRGRRGTRTRQREGRSRAPPGRGRGSARFDCPRIVRRLVDSVVPAGDRDPEPNFVDCAADSAHDAYLRELSRAVSARPTDPDREVTLSLRMRPRSTSRHFEATTMTQCASSRSQQT